ncbi:UNVERIFIED_CONTAM: hypothetical protein FKN15_005195 [Acipenser sinensis]
MGGRGRMSGERRKSCRRQRQQLPPGVVVVDEWCPGCGEFGHTVAICPTQYQGEEWMTQMVDWVYQERKEGEDEHTLSSEACAISRPLFFTLETHHAATQELQRQRTTQLSVSLQASPQAPDQTTGVAGAR